MKKMILTFIAILGIAAVAMAAEPEVLSVNLGLQKTSVHGKITVKFISAIEDSRCPVGTTCVWAGNAKIKITLKKGKKSAKSFELNSTLEPNMILFEGYEIRFVDLTPRPGEMVKAVAHAKAATVSITKHAK